jgi:hypothetical protein
MILFLLILVGIDSLHLDYPLLLLPLPSSPLLSLNLILNLIIHLILFHLLEVEPLLLLVSIIIETEEIILLLLLLEGTLDQGIILLELIVLDRNHLLLEDHLLIIVLEVTRRITRVLSSEEVEVEIQELDYHSLLILIIIVQEILITMMMMKQISNDKKRGIKNVEKVRIHNHDEELNLEFNRR